MRGRALLTLLALTLSGAVFLSAQTTAYSITRLQAQLDALYPWDIQIALNTPLPIERVRAELAQVPNVGAVEEHSTTPVRTPWGTLRLQGCSPETRMYQHLIIAGRWFEGDEASAMVISDLMARKTHLKAGDTVALSIPAGSKTWLIIGIAHDPTAGPNVVGTAFVTTQGWADFTRRPAEEASGFLIQARDRSQPAVNGLATVLDEQLSTEGLAPSVLTHQQSDQAMQMQSQALATLLYAIAVVVALSGSLSLANTLAMSVLERRREIGIWRAMGATGGRVASVFWVEGIALAFIAWGMGMLVGLPGAVGFLALISQVFLPLDFAFNPTMLATMLAFILVVATIASWGPALSAARMRIAAILRYE